MFQVCLKTLSLSNILLPLYGYRTGFRKAPSAPAEAPKAKAAGGTPGEVVTLDSFRKK